MFWDKKGGELTGQPVGPTVGTTAMTAVMSANRVDIGEFYLTMLCVPAYTHERRPYSATLYPTSFTFDSLHALTISARKAFSWCSTPSRMAGGDFLTM